MGQMIINGLSKMDVFKFFSKKSFDLWDTISIVSYLLLSVSVLKWELFIADISTSRNLILGYTFCTPLFLYLFNYKSLRNVYSFIIWVIFCVFHIYLYRVLILNLSIQYVVGSHPAEGLQYSILFLFIILLFRVLSLLVFKRELVAPVYLGFTRDMHDNRRITFWDYMLFVVYLLFFFLIIG